MESRPNRTVETVMCLTGLQHQFSELGDSEAIQIAIRCALIGTAFIEYPLEGKHEETAGLLIMPTPFLPDAFFSRRLLYSVFIKLLSCKMNRFFLMISVGFLDKSGIVLRMGQFRIEYCYNSTYKYVRFLIMRIPQNNAGSCVTHYFSFDAFLGHFFEGKSPQESETSLSFVRSSSALCLCIMLSN